MAKRCFKAKRLAAPYVMLIILQRICEAKSIFTVFWWGFFAASTNPEEVAVHQVSVL